MARAQPASLLREEIYARVRESILACELLPGAAFREGDFAERFGVSKSPVRDALLRLQQDGLIEVLPRKGYRVRPISLADALELYEMRFVLESACAERTSRAASASELASLDAFRSGPDGPEVREWIAYNRRFHLAVAEMCGNNRLRAAAYEVITVFDRLTHASIFQLESDHVHHVPALYKMDREHTEIIAALQARNGRRAVALVQAHIERSRTRFLESYRAPASILEAARPNGGQKAVAATPDRSA
jgi:DNA-binding GntR family transcriptional regulator